MCIYTNLKKDARHAEKNEHFFENYASFARPWRVDNAAMLINEAYRSWRVRRASDAREKRLVWHQHINTALQQSSRLSTSALTTRLVPSSSAERRIWRRGLNWKNQLLTIRLMCWRRELVQLRSAGWRHYLRIDVQTLTIRFYSDGAHHV